jgi:hypothetical protein
MRSSIGHPLSAAATTLVASGRVEHGPPPDLSGDRVAMLRYLPFLLVLALWIYAFVDCLNTPEEQVRNLPKIAWVVLILLFGEVLLGPIAWLAAGRPRAGQVGMDGFPPAEDEPVRHWVAPDDNPEFLRSLGVGRAKNEAALKDWEADLRRREEELRRKENGGDSEIGGGQDDTPPAAS